MRNIRLNIGKRIGRFLSFFRTYIQIYLSGQFDRKWYARAYPDVVESGGDLLKHYIRYGAAELRNPNQEFDTRFYLMNYPDVAELGINPLLHYIRFGRREGRVANQAQHAEIVFHHHVLASCRGQDGIRQEVFQRTALILAEISLPQCLKYRVKQSKKILEELGYRVSVLDWREFQKALSALQSCSLVLFYRVPLLHGYFAKYFSECRRLKIKTGYDIDDPMFDACTVARNANIEHLDASLAQSLVNDAPMFQVPVFCCDFCVVSTEGMRIVLEKTGYEKPVIIRPNGLDDETLAIAEKLNSRIGNISDFANRNNKGDQNRGSQAGKERFHRNVTDTVTMMYATPSLAHQEDFLLIENVLFKLLSRFRGQVRLLLVGTLPLSDSLATVSQWIDNSQAMDYNSFMELLAGVDINLVPLVADAFNSTKSNIKFLDAAVLGVPSVCSPVGDYLKLTDGECCFLASSDEEWLRKLSRLIDDPGLRENMGKNAAAFARHRYSMQVVASDLADYLGDMR